jgi:hypothetical protein
VQGEIIAGAIAARRPPTATALHRPRPAARTAAGENYGDRRRTRLEFSINPERVAPVLRRLISPTKTRARIYDPHGYLILDSRNLYIPGEVLRFDLPPPTREARHRSARMERVPPGSAAATCRSIASSARERQGLSEVAQRCTAPRALAWCASTTAAR